MKKIYILSITLLFFACSPKAKKPFVILGKTPSETYSHSMNMTLYLYEYQDSMGVTRTFHDRDIYSVGDTLK